MMWGYYDGYNAIWMAVTMLLFWGGLAAIAFFGIRAFAPRKQDDGALEILRKRLAAGEIDQAEFADKKRMLQG